MEFELEGRATVVHPCRGDGTLSLSIEGCPTIASLDPGQNEGEFLLELEGGRERVFVARLGDVQFVHFRGRMHRVETINALERARQEAATGGGDETIRAPMPGVVVGISVAVGAQVESGQLLMTIESMKLQTAIVAPSAARVVEIFVSKDARFDQGTILLRLEADDPMSEDSDEAKKGESH